MKSDVLRHQLLLLELGLRAGPGEVVPVLHQTLVNSALPGQDILALILDILHARSVGPWSKPDVRSTLLDVAEDLGPASGAGDVVDAVLEAHEDRTPSDWHLACAEPAGVSEAILMHAKLQAPIMVAGLQVVLHDLGALAGHALIVHVVLQTLDDLSVAMADTAAELGDGLCASVSDCGLHGDVHGGDGALDDLQGSAALGEV
mmetsp:Transcript_94926/g.296860  ORF Transcript_94926/g.296860 Transcript_94926/m.296860 type:complete len:203 (+) Transcript_94926:1682-2290(+)